MLNFYAYRQNSLKHFLAHWHLALQTEYLVLYPFTGFLEQDFFIGFLWQNFFDGIFISGITYPSKKSCCRKPTEEIQSNQPCWSWGIFSKQFLQQDFSTEFFQQDFLEPFMSLNRDCTVRICLFINFVSLIFQVRERYFVAYCKQQVWLKIQNFRCPYQMRWPLLAPRGPEVSKNQAYLHTF